jgi:hypothetical protein
MLVRFRSPERFRGAFGFKEFLPQSASPLCEFLEPRMDLLF